MAGVIHRKVHPDLFVNTLFGRSLVRKECTNCGRNQLLSTFYLKGGGYSGVRNHCVECWDVTNGKNQNLTIEQTTTESTLDIFIEDEVDA